VCETQNTIYTTGAARDKDLATLESSAEAPWSIATTELEMHRVGRFALPISAPDKAQMLKNGDNCWVHVGCGRLGIRLGIEVDRNPPGMRR